MATSLSVLQSGVVGVNPRILFLETTEDQAIVFGPGFINELQNNLETKVQKGDFLFVLFNSDLFQEMAIPQFDANGIITLLPVAGDINTGGPIDGGQNLGFGEGVFAQVAGSLMQFKTLVAGTNVTLSSDANSITINSTASGTGTITGGQNLGVGDGVYSGVSGPTMQFKSLTQGANIILTPGSDSIEIAATSSAGGTITDGVNLGGGNQVFASASGADLQFRTLIAGSGIDMVQDANTITVSGTGSGGGDITGGTNIGGGTGVFAGTVVPNLEFKTLFAGPNINITSDSTSVTIGATGGGGGNHLYTYTLWVAQNGNNSNSGRSINEPLQTIQAALNLCVTGFTNVINVVDSGIYLASSAYTIPAGAYVIINAPGARIGSLSASANLFTGTNVTSFEIICDYLNWGPTKNLFNFTGTINTINIEARTVVGIINNTGSTNLYAKITQSLSGDITSSSSGTTYIDATGCDIVGSINDTGPASDNIALTYISANTLSGDISSTNQRIYGNIQSVGGTLNPLAINNGFFNGDEYLNQWPIRGEVYSYAYSSPTSGIWSFFPGYVSGNQQIIINSTNGVITLPLGGTVPPGWRMTAIQTVRSSGATVQVQSPDTFNGQFNTGNHCYTGAGKAEFIRGPANTGGGYTWVAAGNVFQVNAAVNTGDLYVSQDNGSDTDGDGSFANPFASFNAAITAAGSPSERLVIICNDAATYQENITIANSNISIFAPGATIAPTSGDVITLTSSASNTGIVFAFIEAPVGQNAINSTGTTALSITGSIIGNVTTSAGGTITIAGPALLGNLNAVVGNIRYIVQFRSGTNTGTIIGLNPDGSTAPTFTVNDFVSDGLSYPTADAPSGYVVTTNGAGVLSLQPPAGGGLPFIPVAGTSQTAVAGNAYVCQNAAQTTVLLPATCALGDTVRVYGQGAGGWTLQANGGQTINLGTSPTSTGGSLTSAAANDLLEVSCLVPNTTWQVNYVYSTGLSIA